MSDNFGDSHHNLEISAWWNFGDSHHNPQILSYE